jgi:hypothetical protein
MVDFVQGDDYLKKIREIFFVTAILLVLFCGASSISPVHAQGNDYVLAELVTSDPVVDGTFNADEYGTGNNGKTLTFLNMTGPGTLGVTVFAARNDTHLFMGLNYSDPTKATTDADAFYIMFDEDEQEPFGDWVDFKSAMYIGSTASFMFSDQFQNITSQDPPSPAEIQNIEGAAVHSANMWTWEICFPLASGDVAGHDVNLSTNDTLTFSMLVLQESPSGGSNFILMSCTLAIDNPPPPPPAIRAGQGFTAPTVDGTINQDEYGELTNVTHITVPESSGNGTVNVTIYAVWIGDYLYLAFTYTDDDKASGTDIEDGVALFIDIDGDFDLLVGDTDLKGVGYVNSQIEVLDMYKSASSPPEDPPTPDTVTNITGAGTYAGGNWTWEMCFPLDSGDPQDVDLITNREVAVALLISDNVSSGLSPNYMYGIGFYFPLIIDDNAVVVHTLAVPTVSYPNGGETVSGVIALSWDTASDSFSHPVTYGVYYSADGGVSWSVITTGLDITSFDWDTTTVANGTNYQVKVNATCPGGLLMEDISDGSFTIDNVVVVHTLAIPTVNYPNGGETVSGVVTLNWAATGDSLSHTVTYEVYYSANGGFTWTMITIDLDTTSFDWDTTTVANGTNYQIKVKAMCTAGLLMEDNSDGNFTIDNVGIVHTLAVPTVDYPNGGETVSGKVTLNWATASDSLSHTVTYGVYYSADGGVSWTAIATGLGTTSFNWDTTSVANGTNYQIKVNATCTGGLLMEDVSDNSFTIKNEIQPTTSIPSSQSTTESLSTTSQTSTDDTSSTPQLSSFSDISTVFFSIALIGIIIFLRRRK